MKAVIKIEVYEDDYGIKRLAQREVSVIAEGRDLMCLVPNMRDGLSNILREMLFDVVVQPQLDADEAETEDDGQ